MATSIQIVFDANDPARLADFWALTLGYIIQPPPEGFGSWDDWAQSMGIPEVNWNDARAVVDPDGAGPRLFFQKVPEGKTAETVCISTSMPVGVTKLPQTSGGSGSTPRSSA